MGFEKGSITVTVCELNGDWPDEALNHFENHHAGTLDSVRDEVQTGWTTGRCLLDTELNDGSVHAGGCWFLNLRRAQRKVPAALLNAIVGREELVWKKANNAEYVNAKQRRMIREEVNEQYLPKMPPALQAVPMVYDPAAKLLYVGTGATRQLDDFIAAFYEVMKVEPVPVTPALILGKEFQKLETDLPILQISSEPTQEMTPGRDFLTYLWYLSETGAAKIEHEQYGEFDVMIEAPLILTASEGDAARGAAETAVKKGDRPQHSAEVRAAFSVGKKLRKAKVTLTRDKEIWSGTFDADKFSFGSLKLPEGEEMDAESRFAERMQNLLVFHEAWCAAYKQFAKALFDDAAKLNDAIRDWAENRDSF